MIFRIYICLSKNKLNKYQFLNRNLTTKAAPSFSDMDYERADLIIFGATGFTGKYLVEECAALKSSEFTWAIAGRNNEKMRDMLEKTSLKIGIDVSNIPAINANCEDESSLAEMAKRGKVIINCCGPYRFTGESVVKACIENGADYVDITGEPEFMDKMQLLYQDVAKAKRCYIVNSCGMDSIPSDIGVLHFTKNFPGQVNYVESYMRVSNNRNNYEPICNATTWDSAVHGFSNQKNLIEIRRQLFSKMRKLKPLPPMPRRPTIHRSEVFDNKYSIIFPGADRSVVGRTQMFLASEYNLRPIQYNAYMICDSTIVLLATLLVGYFLQTLTKYNIGRRLLMRFPEIFSMGMMSRNGPSEETAKSTTGTFRFTGEGWSVEYLKKVDEPKTVTDPTDLVMTTQWEIKNPAYGFTAMSVVLSALTLIKERQNLPPSGGVYTPAGAFYNTKFLENLQNRGVKMTVMETRKK